MVIQMMGTRTSFFSRYPWVALFAINVMLLFIVLVLFELGLRLFTPEWLEFRMHFLNAGQNQENFGTDKHFKIVKKNGMFYSFEPGSIFPIRHYEYANTVKIDSLGGRANGSNITRSIRDIIPFIGDSFIFGVGVKDDEHVTALLSGELKANFFNLGVPGTALSQQREILHSRLKDLGHPKKVLWAFFLGNDFEELVGYHENAKKPLVAKKHGGIMVAINTFVYHNPTLKKIYIIQFLRQKMLAFFNKKGGQWHGNPIFKIMLTTNDEYRAQVSMLLDAELSAIVGEAEREHFEPFFILIPDTNQINTDIRKRMSDYYGVPFKQFDPLRPNRIITAALREKNLPFIDTTACLSRNPHPAKLYYLQDNHFTAYGNQCFADCIKEAVGQFLHLRVKVSRR
jgi:hypothetical protein